MRDDTFTKRAKAAYDFPRCSPVSWKRQRTLEFQVEKRGINRRAFPRWTAPFEVRYTVSKGKAMDGKPLEIGEGGLSFVAADPIQRETEMVVEYKLSASDSSDWVRVKSVVRHSDGNTTGVEFLNLRRADRLKIIDFVSAVK
jgi:hypothetical protein